MDQKLGSVYMAEPTAKDLQNLFAKYPQLKRRAVCSRIFEEGMKLAKRGQIDFQNAVKQIKPKRTVQA